MIPCYIDDVEGEVCKVRVHEGLYDVGRTELDAVVYFLVFHNASRVLTLVVFIADVVD